MGDPAGVLGQACYLRRELPHLPLQSCGSLGVLCQLRLQGLGLFGSPPLLCGVLHGQRPQAFGQLPFKFGQRDSSLGRESWGRRITYGLGLDLRRDLVLAVHDPHVEEQGQEPLALDLPQLVPEVRASRSFKVLACSAIRLCGQSLNLSGLWIRSAK